MLAQRTSMDIVRAMSAVRSLTTSFSVLALALVSAVGCSGPTEPTFPEEAALAPPPSNEKTEPVEGEATSKLPPDTIARVDLDRALVSGPAWLFQRVQIEEVLQKNKFVGWRITSMPPAWDRVGLQPGDVVTKINDLAFERPDELWTIWTGLADASTLRLAIERNGVPANVDVKIDGAPNPSTKQAMSPGTSPPPRDTAPTLKPGQRDTIVIGGGSDPREPNVE
jgi:hypothetical protein